jgi:SAM-dependent methyltransferase
MSGVLKLAAAAAAEIDIAALAGWIERNRFMPEPPADTVFVGDGNFRAIGAEFLRHLVEAGGLATDAEVLDIGCGIGRLAVPLTQYLDERGSYTGVDPVRVGIEWCRTNIGSLYPRFQFFHLDLRHPIYNPEGALSGATVRLPFPDGAFDFVAMVSVLTHLPAVEVRRYAGEVTRLLKTGGVLFATAFVAGVAGEKKPRLAFTRAGEGPEWFADATAPLGAVAFDDGFVEETFAAAGLRLRRRLIGNWRGRPASHYQDLFVFEKESTSA